MNKLNSNKSIKDLKQSGLYDIELLERLEVGDFSKLAQLSVDDKNNREFMEPLLYAVKKDKHTYKVYRDYGDELKRDILRDNRELAVSIAIEEPELIEGTPISRNPQFILEHVQSNPKIIRYMDSHLKTNDIFINELNKKESLEVASEIIRIGLVAEILNNPELSNNKEFMSNAIKEDGSLIEFASDKLKNDYNFMKENCSNNKETINYVAEHTQEFGKEGLSATKDALVEVSSDEAISGFKEEKARIEEKITENTEKEETNLEDLLKRDKQLERHIKFFNRIKNGEIDSVRAAKLIDKLCVNLDESYKNEIKQLLKIDDAIIERTKEEEQLSYDTVAEATKEVDKRKIQEEAQIIEDAKKIDDRKTKEGEIGGNEGVDERT